jgi:hypothetical protein
MAETPVPHAPADATAQRLVRRALLGWVLLALTIALTVVLQAVNVPLKTPAAPQGIVSYELAGTTAAAQGILDSWDAGAKVHAGFSLGLDYLYMPAYALTIGLACAWAAHVLGGRRRWLGSLGRVLAFGLGFAALLDAVENYALTTMLFSTAADPWPAVSRWCATGKFALIIVGLIYVLVGFVFWLMTRRLRKTT